MVVKRYVFRMFYPYQYKLHDAYDKKADAVRTAKKLKEKGYLVRMVTFNTVKDRYGVYVVPPESKQRSKK